MTTQEQIKQRIITLLETLPTERLEEVAHFVASLRARPTPRQPIYTPVALGDLWAGVAVAESDIAEIRKEIWGALGSANHEPVCNRHPCAALAPRRQHQTVCDRVPHTLVPEMPDAQALYGGLTNAST